MVLSMSSLPVLAIAFAAPGAHHQSAVITAASRTGTPKLAVFVAADGAVQAQAWSVAFAAGAKSFQQGEFAIARSHFEEAQRHDPANFGVRAILERLDELGVHGRSVTTTTMS